MYFNIISYTVFLFVMAMFFPSLIYAPWTEDDPPQRPINDVLKTCAEWIQYNGFTLYDYEFNREKALSRDPEYDNKATTWAALYAFRIGGIEDIYQILPQDFCDRFGDENRVPMRYKSLEYESKNCKDWIHLYGFNENYNDNYSYVMNIDQTVVTYISVWALHYWEFIYEHDGTYWCTPSELCSKMGIEDRRIIPFWCEDGTFLKCMDWLFLFYMHYRDPAINLIKARNLIGALVYYPIRVHYFAERYALDLVAKVSIGRPINELTPLAFCERYNGNGAEPQTYDLNYEGP